MGKTGALVFGIAFCLAGLAAGHGSFVLAREASGRARNFEPAAGEVVGFVEREDPSPDEGPADCDVS